MKNNILDSNTVVIITTCITSFVTILGFILTYIFNKRAIKDEINKQRTHIHLDKISMLPYTIQDLIDNITNHKKDDSDNAAQFEELMVTIFAYGSTQAISILAKLQENNFAISSSDTVDLEASFLVVSYYILLLCQIKFDLTGIKVNPDYWYRMKFKDYKKTKKLVIEKNNQIVRELKLKSFFIIE